jgi:glutamine amidotransferase
MSAPPVPPGVPIAIVDYGMGNRRSVEKAFAHVGVAAVITRDHDALRAAPGIVLPGVGAFPRAVSNLSELGLDAVLRARLAAGVPVLGICLGLQLAFESSTEMGGARGLGVVPGEVRQLESGSLKLPHIGWNEVAFTRHSPLLAGLPERCAFYHVHSFAPAPREPADVLGTCEYGERFVTMVQRNSFFGVQFHPEKSSLHGLRLLANFAELCAPGITGARAAGSGSRGCVAALPRAADALA